jgi:sulfur relay (sulfurtransferase) complex TusBCD TusD component (DsrE family)
VPSLCCLVTDRAPYGSIGPAEAVRHATGALGKGWEAAIALMGDAVYAALSGQSPPPGEWIPLSRSLADFIEAGDGRAEVLVEGAALDARRLSTADLVPGVRAATLDEIAAATVRCERTLAF